MKLRVVNEANERIELAVGGEGHTLLNLLQSLLLAHEDVRMAGYSKPHPLMDRSILYIQMKEGKNYEEALLNTAESAKEKVNEFLNLFKDQVRKLNS